MAEYWVLAVLTAIAAVVTLAPLSRSKKWWVRGWEFPRLQLAVLFAALVAAELILLDPLAPEAMLLIAISGMCFVQQAARIMPYTPLWRREVTKGGTARGQELSIIAANVEMTNRDAPAVLALIDEMDPDVVLTVETDEWWEEKLEPIGAARPHGLSCALDNTYGMHLFSRFPLADGDIKFLVEAGVPSMHVTVTLPSGHDVRLFCVHPAPPSPTENEESTERDVELALVGRLCAATEGPIVVAGDLNDVAWSRTTRRFRGSSGLLDPRIGRGLFNTFHARLPFVRWPLDHFFHSDHFSLIDMRRLPKCGSDHFPIFISLELPERS